MSETITRTRLPRGQKKGFRHTEEAKLRIGVGATGEGRGGFNVKINCDLCEQEMSPANLARHRPACEAAQGLLLHGRQLTIRQVSRLRKGLAEAGWELEEYLDHYRALEQRCEICGESAEEKTRHMADHCHSTHRNRGILCTRCNFALGGFQDSVEILWKAIEYIERYSRPTRPPLDEIVPIQAPRAESDLWD